MVTFWKPEGNLLIDFECYFHMCEKNEYFKTLHMEEGRVVFLRKYKAYKVQVTSYDV